ncbi:MAG: hypothetical protein HGA43_05650 [Nitrospirae bacterium]|nr:hypothetical protein [Nitrospirota bacterium]
MQKRRESHDSRRFSSCYPTYTIRVFLSQSRLANQRRGKDVVENGISNGKADRFGRDPEPHEADQDVPDPDVMGVEEYGVISIDPGPALT